MTKLKFKKMHGLGNDFVVIDSRSNKVQLSSDQITAIADRRRGVGCDQLIMLELPVATESDLLMRIYNADGGEVEACGNATRCVADLIMAENFDTAARIETSIGILIAQRADGDKVTVDMGVATDVWNEIPLAESCDTLSVNLEAGPLKSPTAVGIGNPHAVFFVDDPEAINLEDVGPAIEYHVMFPKRTNVEAVRVQDENHLRVRVWERGVGITPACGTGACAAVVAAHRRGLAGRQAEVRLDGGILLIEWQSDGHVLMTGPTAKTYEGTIDLAQVQ